MGGKKKSNPFKKLKKSVSDITKSASKTAKSAIKDVGNIAKKPLDSKALRGAGLSLAMDTATKAGETIGPKIQQTIQGIAPKGTFVGDALDSSVRAASLGAVSIDGGANGGWLEQGNPLEGNKIGDALLKSTGILGNSVVEPILDQKREAEIAADEAKDAAQDAQERLRKEAAERERQEKALKDAASSRSRRRGLQLRRARGEGRGSTLAGGKGKYLGSFAGGDSLLGA